MYWNNAMRSGRYAAFRPHYSSEIVKIIRSYLPSDASMAVDFGCGSGQLTSLLPPLCGTVVGVDCAASQVAEAPSMDGVSYVVADAATFRPASQHRKVDLITVAQCLHWFNIEEVCKSFHYLLRDESSIVVVICYQLPFVVDNASGTRAIQEVDHRLMRESLWPPERRFIDDGYAELCELLQKHRLRLVASHTLGLPHKAPLKDIMCYFASWSGLQNLLERQGTEPHEAAMKVIADGIVAGHPKAGDEDPVVLEFPLQIHIFCRRSEAQPA